MSIHDQLCERARRWLRGTRRCKPVLHTICSCSEIPDAIGWNFYGSTVVECKASVSDFYADRKKYFRWRDPKSAGVMSWPAVRFTQTEAAELKYELFEIPRMGTYRYYMSLPGVITKELVEKYAINHGLLWVKGRSVQVVRQAEKRPRDMIALETEVRYLRFAILNNHKPYTPTRFDDVKSVVEDCGLFKGIVNDQCAPSDA